LANAIPLCMAADVRGLLHGADAAIPTTALIIPSLGARCEYLLEIRLRRAGEAKSRHLVSGGAGTVSE